MELNQTTIKKILDWAQSIWVPNIKNRFKIPRESLDSFFPFERGVRYVSLSSRKNHSKYLLFFKATLSGDHHVNFLPVSLE